MWLNKAKTQTRDPKLDSGSGRGSIISSCAVGAQNACYLLLWKMRTIAISSDARLTEKGRWEKPPAGPQGAVSTAEQVIRGVTQGLVGEPLDLVGGPRKPQGRWFLHDMSWSVQKEMQGLPMFILAPFAEA